MSGDVPGTSLVRVIDYDHISREVRKATDESSETIQQFINELKLVDSNKETPVVAEPVFIPPEDTPVEATPVEATSVEATPVEDTPVEDTPVEDTPVEATTTTTANPVSDSSKQAPVPGKNGYCALL